jgi:TRAP-type C4-dicarboxylate transport system permease small subunit
VSAIERAVAALSRLAGGVASIATVLCLVLICWSVGARYLFNAPQPWIDKAAGWCVVALVLLAAPETQRRFEHIGVDVAVGRLGPRLARVAHLSGVVSVAVVAGVLVHAGIEAVEFGRLVGLMNDIEGVPRWWIDALLPIGAAVLLVVALAQAAALLIGRAPPHLPRPDEDDAAAVQRDALARGE